MTVDEEDKSWKNNLKNFKQVKSRETKIYMKLKSLSSPEVINKMPITRQKGKYEFKVKERQRISVSDINSSTAMLFLNKNKREFGSIGTHNNTSEKKIDGHNDIQIASKIKAHLAKNHSTQYGKGTRIHDRMRNISGLALQLEKIKKK